MQVIYKYPITIAPLQTLEIHPWNGVMWHVGRDAKGQPCLWVSTEYPLLPKTKIHVILQGTGIPYDEEQEFYVGTLIDGDYIWHVLIDDID
jgi:hypothetical protein